MAALGLPWTGLALTIHYCYVDTFYRVLSGDSGLLVSIAPGSGLTHA